MESYKKLAFVIAWFLFASIGAHVFAQSTNVVTGRVTDTNGSGIGNVTLTISGAPSGENVDSQTDANGNYSFTNSTGGNKITPSKSDYTFSPISVSVISTSGIVPISGTYNFTGTLSSASPSPTPVPSQIQFDRANYTVNEGAGLATITVIRSGGTSTAAVVDYATSDGTAKQRSDYTLASGTLSFVSGETSKTFTVLITDNAYVDGSRTVNLSLGNHAGATLGSQFTAVLTIQDNDTIAPPAANPVDDARFFVGQTYMDFLSRSADSIGLDYWTNSITSCKGDPQCINSKRVIVSAAFFIEQEFQLTGNYVYRLYKAAFGQRPTFAQFMPDRARINPDASQIEASKQLFANLFTQRPEFLAKYPATMTPDVFIDLLIATVKTETGGTVDFASQRAALLSTLLQKGRGSVVRQVAEDTAFQTAQYNKAFVTMQYFGYLRRDPEDGGYNFWLDVLNNKVQNNYRGMVCAFITSAEYQDRFSSVITRNDSTCGQVGP